jgi:hypothetical protein
MSAVPWEHTFRDEHRAVEAFGLLREQGFAGEVVGLSVVGEIDSSRGETANSITKLLDSADYDAPAQWLDA